MRGRTGATIPLNGQQSRLSLSLSLCMGWLVYRNNIDGTGFITAFNIGGSLQQGWQNSGSRLSWALGTGHWAGGMDGGKQHSPLRGDIYSYSYSYEYDLAPKTRSISLGPPQFPHEELRGFSLLCMFQPKGSPRACTIRVLVQLLLQV